MEEIRQFKNLVGKYNPYFKRHSAIFYLPNNLKELEPMKIIEKSMELLDISGNMTFKSANESISAVHVLLSRFYPDFIQILSRFCLDFI